MKSILKGFLPIHRTLWVAFCILLFASCSVNKANNDDSLKKYFDENGVDGCFTMLNNADGKVTVYNMKYDTMRFSPASTFKIFNSLVGLQTGVITDEKMVIKWNGIKTWNEDWNRDMDMTEAFRISSVPYYQEVARRIGKDTMQQWIDSLGYGNKIISGPVDSFWLNNTLKISPDEQLGLLKKLYFDQLPFRKSVQQMVRDVMLQENNTAYQLSYKTGWGFGEDGNAIGWLVGWIEENKHVYFFVTFVKAPAKEIDMKTVRLNITKGILKQYGFFEGKK
ncbi:MAG: class D beta-lactamase [Chitinophagaceae bacterium]|nr:class D beta-lactamase [Chitinophagaceae bacterium]MBK9531670.1 class D beta-lactamase [Chitinophagaceae bacterium]